VTPEAAFEATHRGPFGAFTGGFFADGPASCFLEKAAGNAGSSQLRGWETCLFSKCSKLFQISTCKDLRNFLFLKMSMAREA
jgi:hypothetical protein